MFSDKPSIHFDIIGSVKNNTKRIFLEHINQEFELKFKRRHIVDFKLARNPAKSLSCTSCSNPNFLLGFHFKSSGSVKLVGTVSSKVLSRL